MKSERGQWLIKQAYLKANQSIFEKKIENQLDVPLTELRLEIPHDSKWGVKKNSEGKKRFLVWLKRAFGIWKLVHTSNIFSDHSFLLAVLLMARRRFFIKESSQTCETTDASLCHYGCWLCLRSDLYTNTSDKVLCFDCL